MLNSSAWVHYSTCRRRYRRIGLNFCRFRPVATDKPNTHRHSHAKSSGSRRHRGTRHKSIGKHIITQPRPARRSPSGLDYVNLSTSLKTITINGVHYRTEVGMSSEESCRNLQEAVQRRVTTGLADDTINGSCEWTDDDHDQFTHAAATVHCHPLISRLCCSSDNS